LKKGPGTSREKIKEKDFYHGREKTYGETSSIVSSRKNITRRRGHRPEKGFEYYFGGEGGGSSPTCTKRAQRVHSLVRARRDIDPADRPQVTRERERGATARGGGRGKGRDSFLPIAKRPGGPERESRGGPPVERVGKYYSFPERGMPNLLKGESFTNATASASEKVVGEKIEGGFR